MIFCIPGKTHNAAHYADWTRNERPAHSPGRLWGWFSGLNLSLAKDFGLFCFVLAATGVESRSIKDASTMPSS